MEMDKPKKEDNIQDLSPSDFQMKTIERGPRMHNTIVNVWKSTIIRINDRLEELKIEKATLKTLNKELTNYIRVTLGPLSIVPVDSASIRKFDPKAWEDKNLLVNL